jgi:very-short-patch-repair endonuclease
VYLAAQQNGVPVIPDLRITNAGSSTLRGLRVDVQMDPAIGSWEAHLDAIEPGKTHRFTEIDLQLSASALRDQTERTRGTLTARLLQGASVLAEQTAPIEVLAANEWPGLNQAPELLAAFVSPNDHALRSLLPAVAQKLEELTGNSALDGYQSRDPQRVADMAAAVYAALQATGLGYINPPASFEASGQKVRTHEQVLSGGMGTCLDLTVLMAAVMEQCGLHPVLVLVQGHAFPGVWLTEFSLQEPFHDDPLPLRKRVALDEALVIDSSAMTTNTGFERALAAANDHLKDTTAFRFVVDVAAARGFGIRPLPKAEQAHSIDPPPPNPASPTPPEGRVVLETWQAPPAQVSRDPGRVQRWKDKLLDLTLRNPMLSFRPGKKAVTLSQSDLATLNERLAAGGAFALVPRPTLTGPREEGLVQTQTGAGLDEAWVAARWKGGEAVVDHTAADLNKRMLELYRYGRSAMEETGSVAIYLALGFMRWRQSEGDKERRAPLILVPVSIERGSSSQPYRLKATEDEVRVNVTLLKFLHKDYGLDTQLLDRASESESGTDVPRLLRGFRELVRTLPHWEVVEEACLAPFSFTKFLMWRDLESNMELLLANKVVKQIFDGGDTEFPVEEPFLTEADLDAKRAPTELLTVLDADPTQLAAVVGVSQGNSFVLQGPPGTGKSQTITNLIGQALAEGRSVLFVSQKMAALDVVHRRLAKVGLGPFCLELHSHKASKRAVLAQIREAVDAAGHQEPAGWAKVAEQLRIHRDTLNRYAAALRAPSGFGPSVHGGLETLIGLRAARELRLPPTPLTAERWRRVDGVLTDLEVAARDVPTPALHAWRGCRATEWSPRWERALLTGLADLNQAITQLRGSAKQLGDLLGTTPREEPEGLAQLAQLAQLAHALKESTAPPTALLTTRQDAVQARLGELQSQLTERRTIWTGLAAHYDTSILEEDLGPLQAAFKRWAHTFILVAFFKLWSSRSRLKAWRPGGLAPNRVLLGELDQLRSIQRLDKGLAATDNGAFLGHHWRARDTDPATLDQLVDWLAKARSAIHGVAGRPEQGAQREALSHLLTRDAARFAEGEPGGLALAAFLRDHSVFLQAYDRVSGEMSPLGDTLSDIQARLSQAQAETEQLSAWCAWSRASQHARDAGMGPAMDAVEEGRLEVSDLRDAVQRALLLAWWEERLEGDTELARFRGSKHEAVVERFRALDAEWTVLVRHLIRARIAKRVPHLSAPGEMKVLQRELQKKSRHKPPRALFAEVPTILRALKPCMLMSPLSVAKYLDASGPGFDLVVFDEASQIPPWDAVGAIARGKQVVVVGDSQQLPPTAFFGRDDDDDDVESMEDLESILDEAVAARLPELSLRWHYRSRHESLIAFSNHHYYRNELNTFPSPAEAIDGLGVHFRQVSGHYDRGGSRTNRAEAQAIVSEVVKRLGDPATAGASIGIVTFNSQQQRHIEDLLDAARQEFPEIERYFTETVSEPVFVKNLENVQGDERDLMLFSICYGPDLGGSISMNFGPLNRKGGERRLNVAVTRAREELIVFSTMVAGQIRLASTRSVGVRHLRAFLDYAQRGAVAIAEAVQLAPGHDTESPFEDQVREVLEQRGWEVHTQIGCSGYRVDLGVVDPSEPGRFLLGIECDGATYHSSANARARDRQRQGVLEHLGWTIHRVWSTDWWHRRKQEVARLEAALLQAGLSSRVQPATTNGSEGAAKQGRDAVHSEPPPPPPPPQAPADLPNSAEYRRATVAILGAPEDFYQDSNQLRVLECLTELVVTEGPVHRNRAARHLAACWGMSRAGGRIRKAVTAAATGSNTIHTLGAFYWPATLDAATWSGFRRPDQERRSPTEIPPREWANAVMAVVRMAQAVDEQELLKESARCLGFTSLGKQVRTHAEAGLRRLVEAEAVKMQGGRVTLY